MAESIELRADLTDFRGPEFIVPEDFVGAKRAAGRRGRNTQGELALAEQGHFGRVIMPKAVYLPGLGFGQGALHHFRLCVPIGRTGFVTLAPDRMGPPFAAQRGLHHIAIDPRFSLTGLPVFRCTLILRPGHVGKYHEPGQYGYCHQDRHPLHNCPLSLLNVDILQQKLHLASTAR